MNYKDVFQLAQEKGYKPHDQYLPNCNDDFWTSINPYWFKRDDLFIELTLIQKWLRDEHKIGITIHLSGKNLYYWQLLDLSLKQDHSINTKLSYYDTYEEALLDGIYEALKLIA